MTFSCILLVAFLNMYRVLVLTAFYTSRAARDKLRIRSRSKTPLPVLNFQTFCFTVLHIKEVDKSDTHIYMHICIYMCIYMYIHICTYIHTYMYTYIYTHVWYMYMYTHTHTCIYYIWVAEIILFPPSLIFSMLKSSNPFSRGLKRSYSASSQSSFFTYFLVSHPFQE